VSPCTVIKAVESGGGVGNRLLSSALTNGVPAGYPEKAGVNSSNQKEKRKTFPEMAKNSEINSFVFNNYYYYFTFGFPFAFKTTRVTGENMKLVKKFAVKFLKKKKKKTSFSPPPT